MLDQIYDVTVSSIGYGVMERCCAIQSFGIDICAVSYQIFKNLLTFFTIALCCFMQWSPSSMIFGIDIQNSFVNEFFDLIKYAIFSSHVKWRFAIFVDFCFLIIFRFIK